MVGRVRGPVSRCSDRVPFGKYRHAGTHTGKVTARCAYRSLAMHARQRPRLRHPTSRQDVMPTIPCGGKPALANTPRGRPTMSLALVSWQSGGRDEIPSTCTPVGAPAASNQRRSCQSCIAIALARGVARSPPLSKGRKRWREHRRQRGRKRARHFFPSYDMDSAVRSRAEGEDGDLGTIRLEAPSCGARKALSRPDCHRSHQSREASWNRPSTQPITRR